MRNLDGMCDAEMNKPKNDEPNKPTELTEKELESVVGGHAVQVAGGLYLDGEAEDQVVRIDGIDTRVHGPGMTLVNMSQ